MHLTRASTSRSLLCLRVISRSRNRSSAKRICSLVSLNNHTKSCVNKAIAFRKIPDYEKEIADIDKQINQLSQEIDNLCQESKVTLILCKINNTAESDRLVALGGVILASI